MEKVDEKLIDALLTDDGNACKNYYALLALRRMDDYQKNLLENNGTNVEICRVACAIAALSK